MEARALTPDAGRQTYGTFHVQGREVALAAGEVQEVVSFPSDLIPLPLVPRHVLGVFDLRGEVVPVIDVGALMGLEPLEHGADARVAIVDCGTHLVGAAVERTGVVLDIEPSSLHALVGSETSKIVTGLLSLDGGRRLVQVLSAAAIAQLDSIPQTARRALKGEADLSPRTKLVFFVVGEMTFAVRVQEAVEIHAPIPLSLKAEWFPGCLGMVDLRGDSIAVADLGAVLGSGPVSLETGKMVFVTDEKDVLGLLVDAVVRVEDVPDDLLVDVPLLASVRHGRWARRVVRSSGGNALLIDVPDMLEALGLRGRLDGGSGRTLLARRYREETEDEELELSWLGIEIGGTRFLVDMMDVREVQELPDVLLAHPGGSDRFSGLMDLRGEVLPVFDLRQVFGRGQTGPDGERVLIVKDPTGEGHCGMIVERLTSILRRTDGRVSVLPPASVANFAAGVVTGMFLVDPSRGGGKFLLLDLMAVQKTAL